MDSSTSCISKCKHIPDSIRRISYGQSTSISPYLVGYRHCMNCDRFFKTDTETHCKCCNGPLRISRNQISRYLKLARKHPEILAKLESFVSRNLQLRKERERIDKEVKETVELILQTKNELEQAIEVNETEQIMIEQQEEHLVTVEITVPNNTPAMTTPDKEEEQEHECVIMPR